jgi:hypothetical protein
MSERTTMVLSASGLILLCVGCTTTPSQSDEPREERSYRTGSNLPAKDYGNVKTVDPAALRDAARRNSNARPGTGG